MPIRGLVGKRKDEHCRPGLPQEAVGVRVSNRSTDKERSDRFDLEVGGGFFGFTVRSYPECSSSCVASKVPCPTRSISSCKSHFSGRPAGTVGAEPSRRSCSGSDSRK